MRQRTPRNSVGRHVDANGALSRRARHAFWRRRGPRYLRSSAEYMNHNRIPHMPLTFKSSIEQIQLPDLIYYTRLTTPMEMSWNNAKPFVSRETRTQSVLDINNEWGMDIWRISQLNSFILVSISYRSSYTLQ